MPTCMHVAHMRAYALSKTLKTKLSFMVYNLTFGAQKVLNIRSFQIWVFGLGMLNLYSMSVFQYPDLSFPVYKMVGVSKETMQVCHGHLS